LIEFIFGIVIGTMFSGFFKKMYKIIVKQIKDLNKEDQTEQ